MANGDARNPAAAIAVARNTRHPGFRTRDLRQTIPATVHHAPMATRVKARRSKLRSTTRPPLSRAVPRATGVRNPIRVIYLYGISRAAPEGMDAGEGVDGSAPVEALKSSGMVCWISRVSRAEFADRLSENMENLEWLASDGVRHQRVVSTIAAATDVVPARFGTVFLSDAGLHDDIQSRKGALAKT